MDFDKRRDALLDSLDTSAFLVVNLDGSDSASMVYLTGFTGEGALLISRREVLLLTDSRYMEQAGREIPDFPLQKVEGDYLNEVAVAIKKKGVERLALAAKRMSHYLVEKLRASIDSTLVMLEDPVAELRRIKDSKEIARIREATQLTEASLSDLLGEIKIGMTEQELALQLELIMRKRGAEKVAFELIVATGENSALPHYRPGRRRLRPGDLLLFDIGARLNGYCADMTRVFAVGKASSRAEKIYNVVLSANQAGIEAIEAGATGKAVDAVARDVIEKAGYKEYFGHGLGHGVGIEVHEGPHLSPLSKDTLRPGMTLTVEPGIYLPGLGGVRIEDLVAVTEYGCEVLTTLPKNSLVEVG